MTVSSTDPAHRLRVAAVQMTSTEDVTRNLEAVRRLVESAVEMGATLVALPENFAYLGADRDHRLSIAEGLDPAPASSPTPGPILAAMTTLSRSLRIHLLLGGFPERGTGPDRIRNTSVLLGPDGGIIAVYRKMHLFDVDLPGGATFRESDAVQPGSEVVVAACPWGGLGLSICYDLRFPELYRQMVGAGARVITVPSAFTVETGKDHWHLLLRARAVENQAYVVAPAQFGHHGGDRRSYGHALVVDPWGTIIAECGDHQGLAVADLDFGYQDAVRRKMPCLAHRRL